MKSLIILLLAYFSYPKTYHYSTEVGLEIYAIQEYTSISVYDVPPYLLKGCATQITLFFHDGTSQQINCPRIEKQVIKIELAEEKRITTIEIGNKQFHN